MITKYDYFLLVAEELNITNAAKRAFVSQQYLSKYICSLEERYNVVLFNRKPYFTLTAAGELMVQRYQQLKALEVSLHSEMVEMKENPQGTLSFGASFGRAMGVLPHVLPEFCARYPAVAVDCKSEMSRTMEKWVLNGNLDMFIGLTIPESPLVTAIPIAYERIYLAISDDLLEQYFPDEYPQCKERFAKGVDIQSFAELPFLMNPTSSQTGQTVYRFLEQNDVHLHSKITVNSNELQAKLSQLGCGVSFCPEFLMPAPESLESDQGSPINFFPVVGLEQANQLVLAYHKDRYIPPHMKYFIRLIKAYFKGGLEVSST